MKKCTVCFREGLGRYYGNRTGVAVCYVCYQKNRKAKLMTGKKKAKIYNMWGD